MFAIFKYSMGGFSALCLVLLSVMCAGAQDVPDSVKLSSIAKLYAAVDFDHEMHVDVAEYDCAACHHHTTGTPVTDPNCVSCHSNSEESEVVACSDCHAADPFSAEYLNAKHDDFRRYHVDMPGLKGAYHENCMGCHADMGGPVGCQDCHERNDAGDAFFNAGAYAPKAEKAGGSGHH